MARPAVPAAARRPADFFVHGRSTFAFSFGKQKESFVRPHQPVRLPLKRKTMASRHPQPVCTPSRAASTTKTKARRFLAPTVLLAGLALGLPAPEVMAQPAAAPAQRYDIAAGTLDQVLNRFAAQAGFTITIDAALTAGKTSAGLAGRHDISGGLAAILAGSGLEAVAQAGGAYTLRRAATPPPAKVAAAADAGATLPTVRVTASADAPGALPKPYAGGQVARGARLGLLGNVDLMDAPFSVTAYTAQAIADQQSATVGEVLRNDPSVRFTTSDGHNAENYLVRGFEINSSEVAFNGMYGMLPGAHVPTGFLERVEVFKGPAAMLSGIAPSGAVGGVINLVPKRAGGEALTRLSASYTSASKLGLAVDIGRRVGEENRLGLRVNASHTEGETTLQDQEKQERFVSLGLDYRGRGWTLELDAFSSRQDQSNGSPLMVGFATLGHLIAAPEADKNALRGTFADQRTEGLALRGEVLLNQQWAAYAALGGAHYRYDGYLNGTRVVVLDDQGNARGQTYNQAGYTHGATAEAGVRGKFTTAAVVHQLTASLSALDTRSGLAAVANSANYTTNLYAPITNPTLAGAHGAVVKTADNSYTSLALSDGLAMYDDQVLLTLGARAQRVRQAMATPRPYDEDAVTPLVGLVVKPWGPGISLYANHIEGLSPGLTVGPTYANEGDTLAPYKTKQAEMGLKWQAESYTHTVSLFRIQKPSTVSIATGAPRPTLALDGEQRNSGLEWQVFGLATPQLRVLGGVAYTRAKQVRAASAANNGKAAPGVPKWTANLGSEWETPWLPGLMLGARVTYTGAQYLDAAGLLALPSWTRWDASARYETQVAGKALALRASVENLSDRSYWSGRFNEGFATLGTARTVKLSAAVDF